jgi:fructose-1,6-bisphosphatase/inositol monophosphatase family enzyme
MILLADIERVVDRLVDRVYKHLSISKGVLPHVEFKADGSRVTEFDRAIESDWREIIRTEFPEHALLGEEYGGSAASSGYTWVFDPIDGTDDFTRSMPLFGYIIALLHRGVPVVAAMGNPVLGIDLRTVAGQGVRVNGKQMSRSLMDDPRDPAIVLPSIDDFLRAEDCSQLLISIGREFRNYRVYRNLFGHISVISGSLDAGLEFDVAPWDFLATRLMVEEVGGKFVYFREATRDGVRNFGVIFGRPVVVESLCSIVSRHGYHCGSAEDFDAFTV